MSNCNTPDAYWTIRRGEDTTATWDMLAPGGRAGLPLAAGEVVEVAFGELGTTGGQVFKLSSTDMEEVVAVEGSSLVTIYIPGDSIDLLTNDLHQADVWRISAAGRRHTGSIELTVLPRVNNTPGA